MGPTGVGKSAVAIELARSLNGEIISADSMQIYCGFDIGTDKVKPDGMSGVRHHLIDLVDDCCQFNASKFLSAAYRVTGEIEGRGKQVIVCGGTALYLRTMIQGIFPEQKSSRISRDRLHRLMDEKGLEYLWDRLNKVDPQYAEKIGKNDRIRVIRALEIYYNNRMAPSEVFKLNVTPFSGYRFCRIGLDLDREILYQRINRRVEKMIAAGLMDEVAQLMNQYPLSCPPFKSVGYREIVMVLQNKLELADAILLIKQRSRNFAKRQLSWFRQEKDITWFKPDEIDKIEKFCSIHLADLAE